MLPRSRPLVLGLLLAVGVALGSPVASYADPTPAPTSTSTANTGSGSGSDSGSSSDGDATTSLVDQAQQALADVKAILDPGSANGTDSSGGSGDSGDQSAAGDEAGAPDATMALHALSLTYQALPKSQRRVAARYLARPDGTGNSGCNGDYACYDTTNVNVKCGSHICVHWVSRSADPTNGVPAEHDGPGGTWPVSHAAADGTPDAVMFTLNEMEHIDSTYVNAGYRRTRGDGTTGGNNKVDIYLADVGRVGVYGYCTSDDPRVNNDVAGNKHLAVSAYCVLDNDYSPQQFPRHTPPQNSEVTAAHEYFHAVQFGYDYDEDAWMMEATATWAEDELYTGVNDNRSYLRSGPMRNSQNPLDAFEGVNEYGAWIFFRYLTEKYTQSQGGLPILVRQIWTRAASSGAGAHGQYSLQAINSVLRYHHTTLAQQYLNFALANRFPASYYSEGSHYPVAKLLRSNRLTRSKPARTVKVTLQRLSARTVRYLPGTGIGRKGHLRIAVDGAAKASGGAVAVRIKRVGKALKRVTFKLNGKGEGTHTVGFGKGMVQWVEITLLNTSTRYRCNVYGASSAWWAHTCKGKPRDNADKATLKVRARA